MIYLDWKSKDLSLDPYVASCSKCGLIQEYEMGEDRHGQTYHIGCDSDAGYCERGFKSINRRRVRLNRPMRASRTESAA